MNVLIFLVSQVAVCQRRRLIPTPGPGPGHSLSQRAAPPSDTERQSHLHSYHIKCTLLLYHYIIIISYYIKLDSYEI